ncbi:MAG: RsfS/YbeB/iojap family protein [Candidatus Enteromonas sp.]|nr:RsfS/YbeB/iojap family protein [Candidatus Enteromonas sp.]MDY6093797.1 RsfS/YbeB/iojap family protein [Candidatus Enteromonas sp.]
MEKEVLECPELALATKTLEDHKAEGIEVIYVADFTPFATYYVIATAPNPRALGAYKEQLGDAFEFAGIHVSVSEGTPESGWVIVQGGEVCCQLFLAANRKEIDLESLLRIHIKKQEK